MSLLPSSLSEASSKHSSEHRRRGVVRTSTRMPPDRNREPFIMIFESCKGRASLGDAA